MYQIFMNTNKSLITTEKIKLYQREKLIDKIQFILPKEYEGYDLLTFVPYIKYTDQVNCAHTELLTVSNDDYKEQYFTCVMPVDTKFTQYAGDINLRLQLTKFDEELGAQVALTTEETVITISPVSDIYEFVPDKSLDIITQAIGEFDAKVRALEKIGNDYLDTQADDLEIDPETDRLYVTAKGVRKGEGVEILTGGDSGAIDGEKDGVLDINAAVDLIEI